MNLRSSWLPFVLAAAVAAQDDVQGKIKELLRDKDDADLKLVAAIGAVGTREAADGLLQAYDACSTLLFRREIARALQPFGAQADTEQPVLTKFAALAGDPAVEEEVRSAAVAGLGRSPKLGKSLLQRLVDGPLPDPLREAALRAHVAMAGEADADWYRRLWNLKQEQRKDGKGEVVAAELNTIRQLAVGGLLPFLSEAEIAEAMKREYDSKIRRALLGHMEAKAMPKTVEVADWLLDRVDVTGAADRALAARIVLAKQPDKAVARFVDLAKKRDVTPEDLRVAMATMLAELRDDATDKKLQKLLGKGKPHEKVFALLATARVADPKFVAQVRKGLADEAFEVRRAAAQVLAQRGDRDAVPDLRKLLASKQPGDASIAFAALQAILAADEGWRQELAGWLAGADRDLRNAAIEAVGRSRDFRHLSAVRQALAHADWSTRWAAVEALQELRDKAAVPDLIARLGVESERLRLRLAEALWQLTAQPFSQDQQTWQAWWEQNGKDFKVATADALAKAEAAREQKRLARRTVAAAKFYGMNVQSQRVLFVLDVSGSMTAPMQGRYVGKVAASRIDVAKAELAAAIEALAPETLFNVMIFSSGVDRWQKQGIAVAGAPDRKAALTWVERLGASGGTNLYDALKLAFEDADVDTIFVMSDGEPSVGAVIDPHRIREEVAFWNRHRKIAIHTIAVGGNLEVLEWLAKDSGGRYVQMR